MKLHRLSEQIYVNPKKLFLIDALGALLSAFLLSVILVKFRSLIGVSSSVLYILALFPIVFATYDVLCYLKVKNNICLFLKIIAYSNILYCFISIGIALYHYIQITYLGWGYFLFEILIILMLATIEMSIANKLKG
jgi:hypothetical protein